MHGIIPSKYLTVLVAAVLGLSTAAHSREPAPAHVGVVAYFEGEVMLDNRKLSQAATPDTLVRNDSRVATANGHAEISFSRRGLLLNVGNNTQLTITTSSSGHAVEVSLDKGELIAVLTGTGTEGSLKVLSAGGNIAMACAGWYRITAGNPSTAAAISGSAEIGYGQNKVEIAKGREVVLSAELPRRQLSGLSKDELYRWSRVCFEYGFGVDPSAATAGLVEPTNTPAQNLEIPQAVQSGKVPLSVVVLDSHGDPVDGLQSSDFRITDSGKQQQIESFRLEHSKEPRPTMILLDLLNASMPERQHAANEIVRAVQKLEHTESLYIYILTIDSRIYAVHPVSPMGVGTESAAQPWSQRLEASMADAMHKVTLIRPVDMTDVDIRTQSSLVEVERLASLLARMPGRKDLIWVTHGVPEISYWVDYSSDIADLGTKLNWADIAVYTVQQSENLRIAVNTGATLQLLSQLTGGRNFGTDRVENAIAQSRIDARIVYELTYQAPVSKPGKYHKVKVACDRPGTQVISQQGYYAR